MDERVTNSRHNFLMTKQLTGDDINRILASVDFADRRAAERCLENFADNPDMQGWKQYLPILLTALSDAADADQALSSFERFVHATDDPRNLSCFLADNPRAVEILITLFGGSRFLTEILLRRPQLFDSLINLRQLAQPKALAQLEETLGDF